MQEGEPKRGTHDARDQGRPPAVFDHQVAAEYHFLQEGRHQRVEAEQSCHPALLRGQPEGVFSRGFSGQQDEGTARGHEDCQAAGGGRAWKGARVGCSSPGGLAVIMPPFDHHAAGEDQANEQPRVVLSHASNEMRAPWFKARLAWAMLPTREDIGPYPDLCAKKTATDEGGCQ